MVATETGHGAHSVFTSNEGILVLNLFKKISKTERFMPTEQQEVQKQFKLV